MNRDRVHITHPGTASTTRQQSLILRWLCYMRLFVDRVSQRRITVAFTNLESEVHCMGHGINKDKFEFYQPPFW